MFYQSELNFFKRYLTNSQLPYTIITENSSIMTSIDLGLRQMIGLETEYVKLLQFVHSKIAPNKLYRIVDSFHCNYFFLLLPDIEETMVFVIGPYTLQPLNHTQLLALSEKYSVSPQHFPVFEKAFSFIPTLVDDAHLIATVHTFAEVIWGGADNFSLETFEDGLEDSYTLTSSLSVPSDSEDLSLRMQALESRYSMENELLMAVSQGKIHKAEMIMSGASTSVLEQRSPDSLRNSKNYTIILNTLLRKAAESGAVHPYHIDRISSDFGKKIELLSSLEACGKLQKEMIRKYCLLVKNHSMKGYSLLIQKVITRVDSDLTADLSLNAMAAFLSVNPSYLSSQFKKETGSTLTDYVNKKRVEHAILLLNSTPLQIQTIAQHCGIPDVNYFTKIFKKYIRKTPKEYRDTITHGL